MLLISHRGNLFGPNEVGENNPNKIAELLDRGIHVEIDVWSIDNKMYLGHDKPTHFVTTDFLLHPKLWCHAKNIEALEHLLNVGAHCFWHETDSYTVTSNKIIWTFPGKQLTPRSVIVCHSEEETEAVMKTNAYGVCSDYVGYYNK
tara:strand:+ start:156 stop:593 length:438 start_codon:yes stop_codon:yes gene_type:complete